MSFHQSGYVFVRVLGAGRHGTMKLAKKKSNAYVKHTKAADFSFESDAAIGVGLA